MTTERRLSATTFLLAMIVALLGIGIWLYAPQAQAQRTGPFMLVAHSNQTANVGIFRIDTSSGSVSFCYVDGPNGNLNVRCTPSVQ